MTFLPQHYFLSSITKSCRHAVTILVVQQFWGNVVAVLWSLRNRNKLLARRFIFAVWIITLFLSAGGGVFADEFGSEFGSVHADGSQRPRTSDLWSLEARLAELELKNAVLSQQHELLLAELEQKNQANKNPLAEPWQFPRYDRELGAFTLIRGTPEHPYELRVDVWAEGRYLNFSPTRDTWTDSTGTTFPVNGIDSIEMTRNFITLSGYAMDPDLQYSASIFSSTALNETVYMGWINYRFSDAFDLRVGNWLVPGTREWLDSVRYTMGVERLMATTFFRPAISPGVWVQGNLWDQLNYRVMLANSFNRWSQGIERVGASRSLAMTAFWEPTSDYGPGPSDFEWHENLSFRLGASMAFSMERNQAFGELDIRNPEDTIVRLSDGTPLFRPGALGPGIQLRSASVNLWAIDAAVKYRGWGISGEYLFRVLNNLNGAPVSPPQSSIFDHGGLLQIGKMIVPRRLEAFGRTSFVTGPFGTGYEYGGGINWHPSGTRDWRFTAEVLQIEDSPAQNLLTGYRAGSSGTLFQLQWFVDF